METYYWVSVYPNYGYNRRFQTDRPINEVIAEYEAMGDYVVVSDENGDDIYRSDGLKYFDLGQNKEN